MSEPVGIVDIDYWRRHVTENVVTTEQALTFLDDIAVCRSTIVRLRAELAEGLSQQEAVLVDLCRRWTDRDEPIAPPNAALLIAIIDRLAPPTKD